MNTLKKAFALTLIMSLGLSNIATNAAWYWPFGKKQEQPEVSTMQKTLNGMTTVAKAIVSTGLSAGKKATTFVWNRMPSAQTLGISIPSIIASGFGLKWLYSRLFKGNTGEEDNNQDEDKNQDNEQDNVNKPVVTNEATSNKACSNCKPKVKTQPKPVITQPKPVITNPVITQPKPIITEQAVTFNTEDARAKLNSAINAARGAKHQRRYLPIDASQFPQEKQSAVTKFNKVTANAATIGIQSKHYAQFAALMKQILS